MTSLEHLTSIILLWDNWKLENFGKIQRFLGLKRQKIVRMYKTCLTSQFLRHSLVRFFREMACLPLRKNLANLLVYYTYYDDSMCSRISGYLCGNEVKAQMFWWSQDGGNWHFPFLQAIFQFSKRLFKRYRKASYTTGSPETRGFILVALARVNASL